MQRARTVLGALECSLSGEEKGESALREDVRKYVEGDADESCFSWSEEYRVYYFDFEELDGHALEEYLAIESDSDAGDDDNEVETSEDSDERSDEKE